MGDLTKNFSSSEFACKCGECGGEVKMNEAFMEDLQGARTFSSTPYTITSGYRCEKHPETIKRPSSSHPKGLAADIATPDPKKRFKVLQGLIQAGFVRIGIGETFIHVDDDHDKAEYVIWDYYS